MCCDKSNIGSAQSSINNGGILENEFINSDGEMSSDIGLI
jgi:predicted acetyltransferase